MRKASILFLISAALSFGQTGVYPPATGGGGGGTNYQTAEANGTAVTPRPRFNLVPGSGMTITPTDNGTDTSIFTFSSTGGGGSATLITQLLDLAPGTPTSTAIPFGGSCTATTPCYVHIGSTRYPFTNTATVNITAGTASDIILFGLDGSGNRTLWYNSANTYTCPNCENAPVGGTSAFPANSTPIWGCSVTSGAFTGTSCAAGSGLLGDDRDVFGSTHLSGSLGISLVPNSPSAGITAINLAEIPRIVTAATDTPTNTDCGNQITYTNATGTTVTLPAANLGGQFLPGCPIEIRAKAGTGTVTVNPQGGSLIDGAASLSISAGQGQRLIADNSGSPGNWQLGTGGQAGGSFLSTTGGTMAGTLNISTASGAFSPLLSILNTTPSGFANIFIQSTGTQWSVFANPVGIDSFGINDRTDGTGEFTIFPHTATDPDRVEITQGKLQLGTQLTPASSSAACTTGTIEADTGYVYVCTATNTWKRSALSTF